MPDWPLLQNNGSFNPSGPPPALKMCSAFPFSPTISTSNYGIHGQCNDLDLQRAVISHAGSRTKNGYSTLQRGLNCPPSRDGDAERFNGSNGNLMLEASLQVPSSTATKQTSVGSEYPRVFCLSACGDLLLSNTGLLGVRCSCHGSHMSVSNFCKHSGLSGVNPGYAVRMDTGECIALWRKLYLPKFGIRAQDDDKGWDWPEGLSTTSSLLRSDTAVPQGGKVFDLSGLFTSSSESIKSSQPRSNVFPGNLQLSPGCANKMSKTEQLGNGCNQQQFLTGHPINPTRNSHSMMDSPLIACCDPSSFMKSRVGAGGSRNDLQSSSFHSNVIFTSENSLGLPYQNVQSTGSKMHTLKDEIVLQKGALVSTTELKLGQPSQRGWCVGSTTVSSMRSNIRALQTTPVQQVSNNLGNSKVIEQGNQPLRLHPPFALRQTKEKFQLDHLLSNAPCSANATSSLKDSRDWLHNISEKLVPISSFNTASGGISLHHKEKNSGINESHNFIPQKLHLHSYVDKSRLMEFSCNGGDGPIRPSGIQESALQKNEKSTKITRCGHSSNVESDPSFRLYVQQMENSGFFMKGVKHSHPNSCTVPDEKVNSLGMAGMLSDAYFHSNHTGNVGSLGSIQQQGHVSSSPGFGATKTMHTRSMGSTPLTMAHGSGYDFVSLHKDVHAVNSQRSDESWGVLTLESTNQGSMGLNQQPRIHNDQRERINTCSVSDVGVGCSFLDPGSSKGRHEHLFNIGHHTGDNTAQTFLPDIGGAKAGNVEHETTVQGHNSWDGLQVSMCGMPSNSEVTGQDTQSPRAPQPKELLSPSWCMLPSCYEGSHTHISGRCCSSPSVRSNKEWYSKDTSVVKRLKRQVSIAVVKASRLDGSRLSDNSTAIEKAVTVECNQKMEQMPLKLDCMGSQWRPVPPNADPISELSCLDGLGKLPGKREVESQLNEACTKDISSGHVVELQGNELSNFSSGSSALAVTQALNEVQDIDSCTVNAIDTGKCNDLIVDQGSVIILSSSVEAIDSAKSSQDACCRKAGSTEEEVPEKSPSLASHACADALNLLHSESKELPNSGDSGFDSGKVSNAMQKNENGSTPRKRKHQKKQKTLGTTLAVSHVSLFPSESALQTRNAYETHAHASEDVHAFRLSNQDTSNILDVNVKKFSFKRRSDLSSVKMPSRKRDLNRICNIMESGSDDQRLPGGHVNPVALPENISVKRLRLVEAAISVMIPVKATKAAKDVCYCNPDSYGTLNCSLQFDKPVLVSHENVCNQKAKPIACGKYGIICNKELDLDQLKPPKIFSLTHILKSSTKCYQFANEHALTSVKNMGHLSGDRENIYGCSTHSSGQVRKLLSCEVGFCEISAQTLQTYHKEDVLLSPDECFALEQAGINGSRDNPSCTRDHPSAQSKPKEIRVRSLYELSMKGKEYLPADFSLCQTVISTECEPERKGCEGTGASDCGECSSSSRRYLEKPACSSIISGLDALCCVCGISSNDNSNCLLECGRCFIQLHQGCYGISRVPKGDWYCRPCNTGARDVVCVLCGYGGGAMTRAFGSRDIVKSLLKAWNIRAESHVMGLVSAETLYVQAKMDTESARFQPSSSIKPVMYNSLIAGLFDRTVRQWVHVVCGLWTPGSRCPNVYTMSAFDVSDVSGPKAHMVCNICKRRGGPCTKCYVETCSSYVHPWCSHQKGLLQSDIESVKNHKVGFSVRCLVHANHQPNATESDNDTNKIDSGTEQEKKLTCARTEVYRGKNLEGRKHSSRRYTGKGKCLVTQVQLDAWLYMNRQKLGMKRLPKPPVSDLDHDYRKEYARYKQAKGWKQLVVYKSGIHALGLYTSQFIPRSSMVVEYVGEIVGPRVADKRESEYLAGRKLQYKGACYFFRIDKEQIIDATRKGGIARFVNHSCEPNCVAKVITVRSEKKVVFFAERDIDPGEEITYDYHFNREDEGKKIPCFCKSSNCRRYLN